MDINNAIHEAFILEDNNYKNIKEYLEFSLADEFSSDYFQRPICEEVCEYIMNNEPEIVNKLGLEIINHVYIGAFDVTDGYVNIFSSDHTVLHINNSEKAFSEGFRKNTKIIDPTLLQYQNYIKHPMGDYNDDIKPVNILDLWDEYIFSLCDISSIDDKYLNKENIPKELLTNNFWVYPKPIGFDDNNKPIVWLFISE